MVFLFILNPTFRYYSQRSTNVTVTAPVKLNFGPFTLIPPPCPQKKENPEENKTQSQSVDLAFSLLISKLRACLRWAWGESFILLKKVMIWIDQSFRFFFSSLSELYLTNWKVWNGQKAISNCSRRYQLVIGKEMQ